MADVKPVGNYHKKTKVPLCGIMGGPNQNSDQNAQLQIIVRHIGTQKERFGSISFSLQRFLKSTGNSFMHWVTLYDSLDDDLFEGDLGVDEDFDYPRILLDYQIISSKFTSMINRTEQLIGAAFDARKKQEQNKLDSETSSKRAKAKKLTNAQGTVEFNETRTQKLTGNREPFRPYVMTEQ